MYPIYCQGCRAQYRRELHARFRIVAKCSLILSLSSNRSCSEDMTREVHLEIMRCHIGPRAALWRKKNLCIHSSAVESGGDAVEPVDACVSSEAPCRASEDGSAEDILEKALRRSRRLVVRKECEVICCQLLLSRAPLRRCLSRRTFCGGRARGDTKGCRERDTPSGRTGRHRKKKSRDRTSSQTRQCDPPHSSDARFACSTSLSTVSSWGCEQKATERSVEKPTQLLQGR